MRIVFLGTPVFAVPPLEELVKNGYNVVAVVTNKDKPVGRKQIMTPSPVKVFANANGIPVYQYEKIRNEGVEDLKSLSPDLMITCAFGQILSQEILDIPKYGVFNIHASLLPKYRGASPIHYAVLNGEKVTGVTIMKTDIGIDTGDIILQKQIRIEDEDTTGDLFEKLSVLGAKAIIEGLKGLENGTITYTRQKDEQATYSKMIRKEDALIDWSKTSVEIVNKIRAYSPVPTAYTMLNGEKLKIFNAGVCDLTGNVGEVVESNHRLIVGCQDKSVSIEFLQKAGGRPMSVVDFLRGSRIEIGEKLG